ncbi:hypothetical protein F4V43_06575 [Paenibacillus spiritus]|uniref:Uncharacterized protein n=1 Tax=Paenibacillus spiritus TaxID=2496557 RepID=A0A5J5GFX0_9BACL|nr:hypothetical protein [Paenibacillus spiritus]KAA9006603.1 hypothetical protein F4V43_06575 [Paenibacillus spiritus]
MRREQIHVPYGYEPPAEKRKGTLVYYDSFEDAEDAGLEKAAEEAKRRNFSRLVLYPLHEETVRRMSKAPVSSFYRREDRLHDWKRSSGRSWIAVEGWEGKRKKYTPVEAALRHLEERYETPLFLYLSPENANAFASYSTFEEWIKRIRLILSEAPQQVHPRLLKSAGRWSVAGDEIQKEPH